MLNASTHVLVASVCKYDDGERCKNLYRSLDVHNVNITACWSSIASSEVVDHKDDQVTDGNKRND